MDWPTVGAVVTAVVTSAAGLAVAVVRSGTSTRDRIDSFRREVRERQDKDLQSVHVLEVKTTELEQRIQGIPTDLVTSSLCQERRQDVNRRIADVEQDLQHHVALPHPH